MESWDEVEQTVVGNVQYLIFRPHVHVDAEDLDIEYPEYKLQATRIESFYDWPKAIKQTPDQLSEAGFFYTQISDRVVCFNCGIGVRAWDDHDDPWEEHAKYSPKCKYLIMIKGDEFVKQVQQKLEEKNETDFVTSEATKPFTNDAQQPADDDKKCCEKWNEKLSEWRSCRICFESEYNIVFIPCGHMMTCAKCAFVMNHCPVCRIPLENKIRVYLP